MINITFFYTNICHVYMLYVMSKGCNYVKFVMFWVKALDLCDWRV